jgi:hypothetical protein
MSEELKVLITDLLNNVDEIHNFHSTEEPPKNQNLFRD